MSEGSSSRSFEDGPDRPVDREHLEIDLAALPEDAAFLAQLVRDLVTHLKAQTNQIERLKTRIQELVKARFGRKSEKMDPNQLLMFGDLVQAAFDQGNQGDPEPPSPEPDLDAAEPESGSEPESKNGPKKGHGRKPLPPHLRRKREDHPVSEEKRRCETCGTELRKIGEEVSEILDYEPAEFHVRQVVREKCACPTCQGNVVVAEMPDRLVDKGMAGPSVIARVLANKYADHLPLNRQSVMFRRAGISIPRQTLCDWVAFAAELLEPIVVVMKHDLVASHKIHLDETCVPVLDPTLDQCRKGRLWAYVGDDRHPHTVFDYSPTKEGRWPREFLARYRGFLQADAYNGFDELYEGGRIVEVACWTHGRRYFVKATTDDPGRSQIAISFIGLLYDIERVARDKTPEDRLRLRQEKSRPIVNMFRKWMIREGPLIPPQSAMGKAIAYMTNHWVAFTRFLDDGNLEIDNNAAERALRRIAVGRNNWTFAGSDEGGRRAAIIYSLVASCQSLDIDPFEYLRDVLGRLSTHPASRVRELTPAGWKAKRDRGAEVESAEPELAVAGT